MGEVPNLTQEEMNKSIQDPMEKHRQWNIYNNYEWYFYLSYEPSSGWTIFNFFNKEWKFQFKRVI